jgi:hypothetical protein
MARSTRFERQGAAVLGAVHATTGDARERDRPTLPDAHGRRYRRRLDSPQDGMSCFSGQARDAELGHADAASAPHATQHASLRRDARSPTIPRSGSARFAFSSHAAAPVSVGGEAGAAADRRRAAGTTKPADQHILPGHGRLAQPLPVLKSSATQRATEPPPPGHAGGAGSVAGRWRLAGHELAVRQRARCRRCAAMQRALRPRPSPPVFASRAAVASSRRRRAFAARLRCGEAGCGARRMRQLRLGLDCGGLSWAGQWAGLGWNGPEPGLGALLGASCARRRLRSSAPTPTIKPRLGRASPVCSLWRACSRGRTGMGWARTTAPELGTRRCARCALGCVLCPVLCAVDRLAGGDRDTFRRWVAGHLHSKVTWM